MSHLCSLDNIDSDADDAFHDWDTEGIAEVGQDAA